MGGTIDIRQGRWLGIIYRLDKRSRMNREIHVWICGSVGVKFPCATRPDLRLALIADISNRSVENGAHNNL